MDALTQVYVARALEREYSKTLGVTYAGALAQVRGTSDWNDHPAIGEVALLREQIAAMGPVDMPPPPELMRTLIEAAKIRLGGVSGAEVWRRIGVDPTTGRDYLGRTAGNVRWPVLAALARAAGVETGDPAKNTKAPDAGAAEAGEG